jgi:hypothetical protein
MRTRSNVILLLHTQTRFATPLAEVEGSFMATAFLFPSEDYALQIRVLALVLQNNTPLKTLKIIAIKNIVNHLELKVPWALMCTFHCG